MIEKACGSLVAASNRHIPGSAGSGRPSSYRWLPRSAWHNNRSGILVANVYRDVTLHNGSGGFSIISQGHKIIVGF